LENNFQILAGQPPNGTDRFPVIEIKDPNSALKGSKYSFKPDLVVANDEKLFVVECKPSYSEADVSKLIAISDDSGRRHMLFIELKDRKTLEHGNLNGGYSIESDFNERLDYCIAYAGIYTREDRVCSLVLKEETGAGTMYRGRLKVYLNNQNKFS